MKSSEVRKKFLDYFSGNGHTIRPSDSLIPSSDPTMLFTSAGMVPFKDYFAGRLSGLSRAASCQKCFRTTDIEKIGRTPRHLSFFEMLGNFSFGDYFKKEAITWAWGFLTDEMKIPKEKLYVTVYKDDPEARGLWEKIIPAGRIYGLGDDTNFWNMGPTGPCGPCSEIIYDLGEEHGCGKKNCDPGCDCARWLEVWNLVFTQFDRKADGKLEPLPKKNIDTGMGLERLAMVVSGSSDVFGTDLFRPVISRAAEIIGTDDSGESSASLRMIADHARASLFLMSDGITASNEGRGYILRRIIRRAQRAAKLLGCDKPFLYKTISAVTDVMSGAYPELRAQSDNVASLLKNEENKFLETLDAGLAMLRDALDGSSGGKLSGKEAFRLYETYGFPYDMTKEICAERGVSVSDDEFAAAQEDAKQISKASWRGSEARKTTAYEDIKSKAGATVFAGYEKTALDTRVAALLKDGGSVGKLLAGDTGEIVLSETPFYAESGGQVADTGRIFSPTFECVVSDAHKPAEGLMVHRVSVSSGAVSVGDTVSAEVDAARRKDIARHHTATHLMHKALRETLGKGAVQAGSLVAPDHLRFDFALAAAPSKEELAAVEEKVNEAIRANMPVAVREEDLESARKRGATALFGEKYGRVVRAVEVVSPSAGSSGGPAVSSLRDSGLASAPAPHSLELCGGTHVAATGEIGFFKIISESSVGSGLRRIVAVCGRHADEYVRETEKSLDAAAAVLRSPRGEAADRAMKLLDRAKSLEKQIENFKAKSAASSSAAAASRGRDIGGVRFAHEVLRDVAPDAAAPAADALLRALGEGVALACAVRGESFAYAVAVSAGPAADPRLAASAIAKEFAAAASASGGGREKFARGGGKDASKISDGITAVEKYLSQLP